ncbi:hypothetical protein ACFLQI_03420 [Candidatus Undinarchaeota archaeon]
MSKWHRYKWKKSAAKELVGTYLSCEICGGTELRPAEKDEVKGLECLGLSGTCLFICKECSAAVCTIGTTHDEFFEEC